MLYPRVSLSVCVCVCECGVMFFLTLFLMTFSIKVVNRLTSCLTAVAAAAVARPAVAPPQTVAGSQHAL